MSVLKEYLGNRRIQAAVAAAGLLAAATAAVAMAPATHAVQAQPSLADRNIISVPDDEVFTVKERVDDQLVQLRRISDSMKTSWSLSSPYVRSSDKARDIKEVYDEAMRNSPHAELGYTDRYFLKGDQGTMSADTRRAITQVNAQKLKYLEATYYLQRLQIALLFGKESDIGEYRERLDKATTDIEGWPKRSEEAFAWNVPKPYRIDLPETDRPRINVEIEPPAKMHVDIEPSRIDVKM